MVISCSFYLSYLSPPEWAGARHKKEKIMIIGCVCAVLLSLTIFGVGLTSAVGQLRPIFLIGGLIGWVISITGLFMSLRLEAFLKGYNAAQEPRSRDPRSLFIVGLIGLFGSLAWSPAARAAEHQAPIKMSCVDVNGGLVAPGDHLRCTLHWQVSQGLGDSTYVNVSFVPGIGQPRHISKTECDGKYPCVHLEKHRERLVYRAKQDPGLAESLPKVVTATFDVVVGNNFIERGDRVPLTATYYRYQAAKGKFGGYRTVVFSITIGERLGSHARPVE